MAGKACGTSVPERASSPRVERLAGGNPGDVRPADEGVSNMRIDYGPGSPVYFKK